MTDDAHVFRQQLKEIIEKNPKTYGKILRGQKYNDIRKWIFAVTDFMLSGYSLKCRCYWILNGMSDFPKCHNPTCENKSQTFIDFKTGFRKYCCRKCAAEAGAADPALTGNTIYRKYIIKYGEWPSFQSDIEELRFIIEKFPFKYEQLLYADSLESLFTHIYDSTCFLNENSSIPTRCYCFLNGITDYPKCANCGEKIYNDVYNVNTGFKKYCCSRCASISEETQSRKHNTNLRKFGAKEYVVTEAFDRKSKATCMRKYGVDRYTKSDDYGRKMRAAVPSMLSKQYASKKRNNSFNVSGPEARVSAEFEKMFGKENVFKQYRDIRYPFMCDIYIKSKDLFVECNFHWTHGGHFFDPENSSDAAKLENWKRKNTKFYNIAADTWCRRDRLKLETAKNSRINYLVFWTEAEAYDWLGKQ